MQNREIYSTLTAIAPFFVRVDGRGFRRVARRLGLKRPFDLGFARAMCRTAGQVLSGSGINPLFAFTFSDEISFYFDHAPFSGRVEKIDSVCASFTASALTLELKSNDPIAFDARVVPVDTGGVRTYLIWRQQEVWRNHVNAYCQQALIEEGCSAREAATNLNGMSSPEMHEMMFSRGVNLAKTPAWQRRGIIIKRNYVEKAGYNPLEEKNVISIRRTIGADTDLPLFSSPEGEQYLSALLESD